MMKPGGELQIDPLAQVRQILGVLRSGWFGIFTMTSLGLLIGLSLFFFLPRQYTSYAKIMLRGTWMFDRPSDIETVADMPISVKSQLLEEELRSTSWLRTILDRLEWEEWARVRDDPTLESEFLAGIKDRVAAAVRTGPLGERLVILEFSYSDREKARDFLAELRDHWLFEAQHSHERMLDQNVADLRAALAERQEDLRQARQDLQEFEAKENVNAIFMGQDKQASRLQINAQLDQLIGELSALEQRKAVKEESLEEVLPDGTPAIPEFTSSTQQIDNDAYRDAIGSIEAINNELQALELRGFTDKYPKVKQLKHQLRELLQMLEGEELPPALAVQSEPVPNPDHQAVLKAIRGLDEDIGAKRAAQARLQRELDELEKELRTLPMLQQKIAQKSNEIEVLQQMVDTARLELQGPEDLLKQLRRPGLDRLQAYSILEEPRAASGADLSVSLVALVASIVLGLGLSLAVVVGREFLKTSFRSADQAGQQLQLPVLGEVAPIQTELEARRARVQRSLQVAASLTLLLGLGASLYVCLAHAELLPVGLVEWATGLREGLG